MIVGVGMDIVDLDTFEAQLADGASSFAAGVFTDAERAVASSRPGDRPGRHLAARYAAKEAFIKAWSGGNFGGAPALETVDLREIEIRSDVHRRPGIVTHGALDAAVRSSVGPFVAHLSFSHDGGYAAAVVIIETRRDEAVAG